MNLNELDQYLELINSVLLKSAVKLNKWREKFMLEVLLLYLIIPGRINFLQPGRYGRFGEQRYSDFHACFHPEVVQTPPIKTPEQVTYTLIDWYLHVPCTRKETLQRLANYVVADAYFSKSTFVYGAFEMGFHVISRFRDDAYFRYLITEEPTGKRGRPKLYDGKIEMEHLEEDRFEIVNLENGQGRILSAVVHSRSLNRNIRLCIHFLFFKCPVVNSISMG